MQNTCRSQAIHVHDIELARSHLYSPLTVRQKDEHIHAHLGCMLPPGTTPEGISNAHAVAMQHLAAVGEHEQLEECESQVLQLIDDTHHLACARDANKDQQTQLYGDLQRLDQAIRTEELLQLGSTFQHKTMQAHAFHKSRVSSFCQAKWWLLALPNDTLQIR